jgi:hypothetical protein
MTVNPIGITNPNPALDPSSFQTRMQQALSPVATLFGESTDQLMAELNSGPQLTNIANRIANHRHGGGAAPASATTGTDPTQALLQLLESQDQTQNQNPNLG